MAAMDFSRPARDLFNRLRGFQPWPGAFTTFKGKTLQVHRAQPGQMRASLRQGELAVEGARLFVGCGTGSGEGRGKDKDRARRWS